MKQIKVTSCKTCPYLTYSPENEYRYARWECNKFRFFVSGAREDNIIDERCKLEDYE